jgi:hypothetical protein
MCGCYIWKVVKKVDNKIGQYYWLCGLINQLPFDYKAKYRAHTFCYILEFLLIWTPFTSWFSKQNCFCFVSLMTLYSHMIFVYASIIWTTHQLIIINIIGKGLYFLWMFYLAFKLFTRIFVFNVLTFLILITYHFSANLNTSFYKKLVGPNNCLLCSNMWKNLV